jgi:hypothetical protein
MLSRLFGASYSGKVSVLMVLLSKKCITETGEWLGAYQWLIVVAAVGFRVPWLRQAFSSLPLRVTVRMRLVDIGHDYIHLLYRAVSYRNSRLHRTIGR